MTKTLAELFAAGSGAPLNVGDKIVHNIYRRDVEYGQIVNVRFVHGATVPSQGLRIKIKDGTVIVNDQELSEIVVWKETAPRDFSFECRPKKKGSSSELRIWNCWHDSNGVTQAWIGNAGIVVDQAQDHVTLKCSPGTGEFDTSALEVELTFV